MFGKSKVISFKEAPASWHKAISMAHSGREGEWTSAGLSHSHCVYHTLAVGTAAQNANTTQHTQMFLLKKGKSAR